MTERHEYSLKLSEFDELLPLVTVGNLSTKPARSVESNALAELMLEAYRGTTDFDGETLEDAIGECRAYLAGERGGQPLLAESRLAYAGPLLVGACLTVQWREKQLPLIAYVMTRADWKMHGVGKQVLWESLRALRAHGHREVRAVVTDGNTPSERLFCHMGFRKVNSEGSSDA